jgi:hypothetical protein
MLGWALASPVTMLALGVVLNPLPNLIEGGPFVSPVLAGLFALFGATLALVVGVPALLRRAGTRARALRFCSAIPLGRWFAAQYAEEELLTILAPFVRDGEVSAAGFEAAAALLSWSRLGEPLREAARSPHTPSEALSLGGLAPLAPHLSLPTSLSVIGGAASKRLAQRMSERSDAVATLLTSRMRMAVRVVAYTLVVAFSVGSLVGLASRGLPEIPGLGGQGGQDEKELQELLKQLQ